MTLALFPPPDLTFLSVVPNALSLFFESEGLTANFTCFSFAGTSVVVFSAAFFEDLRIVLVSEGPSPLEPGDALGLTDFNGVDILEVEGFKGEGRSSRSSEPKKSTVAARAGFRSTFVGAFVGTFVGCLDAGLFTPFDISVGVSEGVCFDPFEGMDFVDGGSGSETCGVEVGFFVRMVSDFFLFFSGSSLDTRVRFFPFCTSSSMSSGTGTRVKPSHLPPSSSSSLQVHIGRLALELVLIWID